MDPNSSDANGEQVLPLPSEGHTRASSEVTPKGSGVRMVTREHLKQVAHLPQQKAADMLNVGNTRFKMALRQLDMNAWPYRKIKSIRNLRSVVQEKKEFFGDSWEQFIRQLEILEDYIFDNPSEPLNADFRRFRQAAYTLTHKSKKGGASVSGI